MQYRDNDYGSYDKDTNKSIDICLTCTEIHCTGECQRIKEYSLEEKEYIIKRTTTTAKGIVKTSYITYIKGAKIGSGYNIWKAKRGTLELMDYYATKIKKIASPRIHFEVVKRGDELEKIAKEKRKTGGHFVDANGNRLGQ